MYQFLWDHVPGPTWAKTTLAVLVVVGVVLLLLNVVFPWIGPRLPGAAVGDIAAASLFVQPVTTIISF